MKNLLFLIIVLSGLSLSIIQAQTGIYQEINPYQVFSPERLVADVINKQANTYQIPQEDKYLMNIKTPLVLEAFMLENIDNEFKEYGFEITGKEVSDIGYILFLKKDGKNYSIPMRRGYIPNRFGGEQNQFLSVKDIHEYVVQ